MSWIEIALLIGAIGATLGLVFLILIGLAFLTLFIKFVVSLSTRFSFDCSDTEQLLEVRREQADKKIIMESLERQIDSLP